MFKEQGKNNDRKPPQLLTSEGAHFKSFRNAIEYMRASYTYNEEDIKGLEFLVEELLGARRTQSEEWLETEGLPGGWKNKVTKVDICGPFKKTDFWNIFTNAMSEGNQHWEGVLSLSRRSPVCRPETTPSVSGQLKQSN